MTKPYWFKDVHRQLQKSLQEETKAIYLYRERAKQARLGGYSTVAAMYDEIRKEEEHHMDEITKAIKELHM